MSGQMKNNHADGLCVHELLELCASRDPQADAVVEDAQRWIYGAVNQRANRFGVRSVAIPMYANALYRRGVNRRIAKLSADARLSKPSSSS